MATKMSALCAELELERPDSFDIDVDGVYWKKTKKRKIEV
jgi:hypothetical protein